MWFDESVFYQIYPMGFCGAPQNNDDILQNRIGKVSDWTSHIKNIGANAVYFSPVFQSDSHGYDTRDYYKIDSRLGSNDDFKAVCQTLHQNGIRVVLDGVFNHVGRGFWAFRDLLEKRTESQYKDWFNVNFDGNSNYNDGFWYEGWEEHYELVRLNLKNPEVVKHIFDAIKMWHDEFGIDGLRLDVAYLLDKDFLRQLHNFCKGIADDFVLIGEMLFGDYNGLVNDEMLYSCTNYECYKGVHSSLNENNLFEIAHSLNRQFGKENWSLYRGKHLLNFVDNHDVSRIASILKEKRNINSAYALMFSMPGVPCIYYGSEWGIEGDKASGDNALRPCFDVPVENEMTDFVRKLAQIKKASKALCYGDFENVQIQNKALAFKRCFEGENVFVCINIAPEPVNLDIKTKGNFVNLLTEETVEINGGAEIKPFGVMILRQNV